MACCLRLEEQFGFEVQTGREPEVSVRRAGEAVDANMLAPAVGVHRSVESDIGALVPGQNCLRIFGRQRRIDAFAVIVLKAAPAVVEALGLVSFEAAGNVRSRGTAAGKVLVLVTAA
jgi:hypothetical protein